MKAIILAAGRGSRMGEATIDRPKCRVKLHGKELIEWQIDNIINAGIDSIGIVRGYLGDTFKNDVVYFDNRRWNETNMVVSMQAAKSWLEVNDCIVCYSDIVYSSDVVVKLMEAPGDIVISYDPQWMKLWGLRFDDPLSDAETLKLNNDRVIEIGKKTNNYKDIEGQYMGLTKFTTKGWRCAQTFLKALTQQERDALDMTGLLQRLIEEKIIVSAVAINDDWFEVDSESDLKLYNTMPIGIDG